MNRGEYRHLIEIWEVDHSGKKNRLSEKSKNDKKVKELFAKIETRVGGLLSGRQADTVMSTVTHKFSWDYNELPEITADKHFIKYRGQTFSVNYSLNEEFKDEELQVFVTEKV